MQLKQNALPPALSATEPEAVVTAGTDVLVFLTKPPQTAEETAGLNFS
jgi:hypothetical protein